MYFKLLNNYYITMAKGSKLLGKKRETREEDEEVKLSNSGLR